jgi:hypothetical protein
MFVKGAYRLREKALGVPVRRRKGSPVVAVAAVLTLIAKLPPAPKFHHRRKDHK